LIVKPMPVHVLLAVVLLTASQLQQDFLHFCPDDSAFNYTGESLGRAVQEGE
jgi:hypothetical protein